MTLLGESITHPYNIFQNGVLLRTVLDNVTGDLSDTRTRYLGVRPVKLFRISMQGSEAVSLLFDETSIF